MATPPGNYNPRFFSPCVWFPPPDIVFVKRKCFWKGGNSGMIPAFSNLFNGIRQYWFLIVGKIYVGADLLEVWSYWFSDRGSTVLILDRRSIDRCVRVLINQSHAPAVRTAVRAWMHTYLASNLHWQIPTFSPARPWFVCSPHMLPFIEDVCGALGVLVETISTLSGERGWLDWNSVRSQWNNFY